MITISESSPKMMVGTKSLFITFDRKPTTEELGIIKSTQLHHYDYKNYTWEVPILELSFLLDNLTYFDSIRLVLEQDPINIYANAKPLLEPKTKSFEHQIEAVEYGLRHNKWMLLDAPGLGKSKSLINLAEELKCQRGIKHCLVICGIASLRSNWEDEIKKHSNLSSMILGRKVGKRGGISYMTMKERAEQLKNPIDEFFIIINIESLRDESIVEAINNSSNSFDMMVFDECHKAKGWSSKQGANLLSISAPYMVAATGTLIMNNPLDSYVPLAWIGVERKNNVTRFKATYCIMDKEVEGRILGFKNLSVLKDEISNCSLRRTKDLLNLPEKNIINEKIEMSDTHRKFYDLVVKGVKSSCDKVDLKSSNFVGKIVRLRQATSCPQLLTSDNVVSTKIERCVEKVSEIVSNGEKVVVFSCYKEPINQLYTLLKEYSPLMATGDMKDDVCQTNKDLFQSDDKHMVFLGTIDKMGTGFTLTRASYMIFIDQPWSEAIYTQASDRIHRIGQKNPVFIYNLICENSIDELVAKIVERKGAISSYTIDGITDEGVLNILYKYIQDL